MAFWCNKIQKDWIKIFTKSSGQNVKRNAFKTLRGRNTPIYVHGSKHLSDGPKHPYKDKLKETHLLADIKKLMCKILENGVWADEICEGEATAKLYAKSIKL